VRGEAQRSSEAAPRRREQSTVIQLVSSGAIPDGTLLRLRPFTDVGPEVRARVLEWVAEQPERGKAIWHNDRAKPLEWLVDHGRYRPTEIVRRVLAEAAGMERTARGPRWWVLDEDGRDLPTVAGIAAGSTFDWTDMHAILTALPAGRWTTYGDLAAIVGTAPVPLGQHVSQCPDCEHAWRVLGADGRSREGFQWSDVDEARSQREVLEAEGIAFDATGRADASARMTSEELSALGD
jgi:alkylated DNA nucleotide flippase Atl1